MTRSFSVLRCTGWQHSAACRFDERLLSSLRLFAQEHGCPPGREQSLLSVFDLSVRQASVFLQDLQTPVHIAAKLGYVELVRLFIVKGQAQIREPDNVSSFLKLVVFPGLLLPRRGVGRHECHCFRSAERADAAALGRVAVAARQRSASRH